MSTTSPSSSSPSDADADTTPQTPVAVPAPLPAPPPTLTLTHHTGDLFAAPPHSILIHACNTQGQWSAGIAAAFRSLYPRAHQRYRQHCLSHYNPSSNPVPTGTCLLIPPCEDESDKSGRPQHWIACLFTSAKFGRAKDKPPVILVNTRKAMRGLLRQVRRSGCGGGGLRMCRINSARFGVPWERTVAVLEGIVLEEGWVGSAEVWSID
ncbi:hypothetical protein BDV95DRAFT_505059 [Massariosphaeria phaeospora]|uniref:ADP-ribose 1''-phosphate phosphatase n=1 Tax=Massariosphaeria phaeospora TaxID=100035 RepID=A0A7C8HZK2_9PLEO|nr:hypothetical protein BDV95DRAFT_505059 [Massariosphaeria phaeospora]